MVDIPNKLENNLDSKKLNTDKTLNDIALEKADDILLNSIESSSNLDLQENKSDSNNPTALEELDSTPNNNIENMELEKNEDDSEVSNCLALTVQKDYSLSIVKNVVVKTLRSAWKIALSIFTLNFLKFFL